MSHTEQSDSQRVADHLAERMIGRETAEETLDRIEHYLTHSAPIGAGLRCELSLAAIRKWRGSRS